jgi:hypothetical protein
MTQSLDQQRLEVIAFFRSKADDLVLNCYRLAKRSKLARCIRSLVAGKTWTRHTAAEFFMLSRCSEGWDYF